MTVVPGAAALKSPLSDVWVWWNCPFIRLRTGKRVVTSVFPPQGWATMRNKYTSWISKSQASPLARTCPMLRPGRYLVSLIKP